MTFNVPLLRRVQAAIEDEPNRIDMRHPLDITSFSDTCERKKDLPACGTIGCIGGWTLMLSDPEAQSSYVARRLYCVATGYNQTIYAGGRTYSANWNVVRPAAKVLLGLPEEAAEMLFMCHRPEDVGDYADTIGYAAFDDPTDDRYADLWESREQFGEEMDGLLEASHEVHPVDAETVSKFIDVFIDVFGKFSDDPGRIPSETFDWSRRNAWLEAAGHEVDTD